MSRKLLLAGASALALVLGSGDASAVVFGTPGSDEYIIPLTGYYDFTVAGADGGSASGYPGGAGALVGGELFLRVGTALDILVGGAGGSTNVDFGGGGGGGSFVFDGSTSLLFAAGGGGGRSFAGGGLSSGIGNGGHPAGPASYGGGAGGGISKFPVEGLPAESGYYGGAGASRCSEPGVCFPSGGAGGFGFGGGGGYNGGGGGGGAPGGGSGSGAYAYSSGGYSFVTEMTRDPFGITGGNLSGYAGDGYVSIDFVGSAVPEPSTWAMMLIGFVGLGYASFRRSSKARLA